jgi:hypothetical protein
MGAKKGGDGMGELECSKVVGHMCVPASSGLGDSVDSTSGGVGAGPLA